jgi:recF protein
VQLNRLRVYNYRRLERADLAFEGRFNLLIGDNATGKTSTLAAIQAAAGVRSATHPAASQAGSLEGQWLVGGEVSRPDGDRKTLETSYRRGELQRQIDGSKSSIADQARALALLELPASGNRLLIDHGNRRRQLDWLLFHVEQPYGRLWARYTRSLQQRNQALRSPASAGHLESWDHELATAGEELSQRRAEAIPLLRDAWSRGLANLGLGDDWELALYPGWKAGHGLLETLRGSHASDRQRGRTLHGPHLAQLRLSRGGRDLRDRVSGGEGRLVELALLVALGQVLEQRAGKKPVLLADDLTAELGARALSVSLGLIAETGWQVVATALADGPLLQGRGRALFHVEQGRVERVVE